MLFRLGILAVKCPMGFGSLIEKTCLCRNSYYGVLSCPLMTCCQSRRGASILLQSRALECISLGGELIGNLRLGRHLTLDAVASLQRSCSLG